MTAARKLVTALVGSALAVTLAALGASSWVDHRTTRAGAEQDLDQRTVLVAEHLRAVIQTDIMLLGRAADHLSGHDLAGIRRSSPDQQALRKLVKEAPGVDSLWIYDAAGDAVLSTVDQDISRLNVADREYFTALRDGEPVFISPMIWGRVTGGFFFVVARRLEDAQGRFLGIATAGVPADRFAAVYHRIGEDGSASFAVRKRNGDVVVRSPLPASEPPNGWPAGSHVQIHVTQADGVFEEVSPVDGVNRLYAFRRLDPEGLVVIAGRSVDAVLAPWRHRAALTWGVGGCGVALSLVLAVLVLRNARREAVALRDALQAVRESEERFDLAVAATDDGIWDWDLRTGRVKRTARMKALYGLADGEMGDRSEEFWDRLHPADAPVLRAAVQDHLERRTGQLEAECRVRHADGTWRWLFIRGRAQFGADGRPRRLIGMMTDVTERKEREDELHAARTAAEEERAHARHAANHDPLTGLPNRAYFSARLAALAEDADRQDRRFALMVLDLDGFKEVNDTLGHLVGDGVLTAVAQRLKGCMRDGDFVARLGGDEFAVLMTNPCGDTQCNAAALADRLIAAVRRGIDTDGRPVRVGCSVGVVVREPGAATGTDEALRRADEALYAAKRAGKGRMAFAGCEVPCGCGCPVSPHHEAV